MVQLGGTLAGPVVAQVVDVHSVHDVIDAAFPRQGIEMREELILAKETAVGIVLDVIRVLEFPSLDVFVPEAALACERLRIALV